MPGDFREHFDLRKLDDLQLGQIEFILTSPAYNDAFKPYIEGILRYMNDQWKDRSQKRKDEYPDDMLGGAVLFGEGLLKFFDLILRESSMERVHNSMANMSADQLYDMKRERGGVRPVVGIDQPATPPQGGADPDEY
jgi:hypothetical protein